MAVLNLDGMRLPAPNEAMDTVEKIDAVIAYLNDLKLQLRYFSTNIGDANINLKDIKLLEEHIAGSKLKFFSENILVDGVSLEDYIRKVINGG